VTTGLRQVDVLYPFLFNIALEKVNRNVGIDQWGVRLGKSKIAILTYANDLVLLAANHEQLKSQSKNLIENAKRLGLEINTEKTEYMVIQRKVPINIQNK
jgi:hypothetical protein